MTLLRALRALLGLSVVGGLLAGLLLLPLVAVPAIGARSTADAWLSLDSVLAEPRLPQRSQILAADGSLVANVFLENREVVPFDRVPQVVKDSFVAVEDARFYEHKGVDYRGLARAMVNNAVGGATQGGSTLTQQYVKNALLLAARTPAQQRAAVEVSPRRKLQEMRYALELEKRLSKDEIFERYLNIAYFGDGAYGIETAARHYFGKSAMDLSLAEAAVLTGLVKNPTGYDPTKDPDAARERRDVVLGRMLAEGVVSRAEYDAALASPLTLQLTTVPNGCEAAGESGFYCDWVIRSLVSSPIMGATKEERESNLLKGGLVVRTPLDVRIQREAQAALDAEVPRSSRVAAASVVVRPGTGEVVAMAVNRTFGRDEGETVFPLASSPSYQPGSTFKAFTLAAALEQGAPLGLTLAGGDCHRSRVFKNPQPSGCFSNSAEGEGSALPASRATALSVNTWFVQLQERVGTLALADMATRLGITSLPREGERAIRPDEGSLTLGAREVSPLDMANAYATFAARGKRCLPVAVLEIETVHEGEARPAPERRCEQVLAPEVADGVTSLLENVIVDGTGEKNAQIGRPAAGKTGTTNDYGAAWFDGYTPNYATAVWLGDPRGPSHRLVNVLGHSRMFGGDLPARVWARTMRAAHEGVPVQGFNPPNGNFVSTANLLVPSTEGLPSEQARAVLEHAGLSVRLADVVGPPLVPAGTAVSSSPAPGSRVLPGSVVTVEVKR